MKNINLLLIIILLAFLVVNCDDSSDSSGVEPEDNTPTASEEFVIDELYRVSAGNTFTYSVDTLNLETRNYENVGTRTVSVNTKVDDGEDGYYPCDENYDLSSNSSSAISKFRLTENSLDFFADKSGVSDLIPDSLLTTLVLELGEVYKLIETPYKETEWSVYKGSAAYGAFKFNIFNITGEYVGSETLQLSEFENDIVTEKFKYNVILDIPNINNPFESNRKTYEANVWFSPEFGVVKLEGCSLFIKPITGELFNDADSNKVSRHVLTSFN